MTIRTQQTNVVAVRFPIFEASPPRPSRLKLLDLSATVNVVDVERAEVVKSAGGALAAKGFDDLHLSLPVARMFVNGGTVLIPVSLLAFRRAKLSVATTPALAAFATAAPAGRQVASLAAIFPGALLETINVHLKSLVAVLADLFHARFFHGANISKYGEYRNSRYFEIAVRRISEALKQPDLFIEPPKPAVQEAML
jgi:hypothetical protein